MSYLLSEIVFIVVVVAVVSVFTVINRLIYHPHFLLSLAITVYVYYPHYWRASHTAFVQTLISRVKTKSFLLFFWIISTRNFCRLKRLNADDNV